MSHVLATTVVRGARRGERHGGLYLVDLARRCAEAVLQWTEPAISWDGAGGDRGLRGIACIDDTVFVAAAAEILVFDGDFELRDRLRNRYLRLAHELALVDNRLWIASTGYDSLLTLDTASGRFVSGLCFGDDERGEIGYEPFDPNSGDGPRPVDTIHLNNVVADGGCVYASARDRALMVALHDDEVWPFATLPLGTHNPRPLADGLVYNDTAAGRAVRRSCTGDLLAEYRPGPFDENTATADASPGFVRGMCLQPDAVIVGASPASLWRFTLESGELIDSLPLETDIHHAVASIVSWPPSS